MTLIRKIVLLFLLLPAFLVFSQQAKPYRASDIKILFLLDVSGSMNEDWGGRKRIDVAKEVLIYLADSIQRKYPNVHFGLRVFGSDFPREQKNCKDSRLLVPFSLSTGQSISMALKGLSPKGMTPIAYSLEQAAKDFPEDSNSIHSIILITDGDENCNGNPCKAADILVRKKISFRPFIIGLGVTEKATKQFECIGQFVNTKDDAGLRQTVGVIIKQTLNNTTLQINLLDAQSNPTVTNVPFTLYDSETGRIEYNFIHTLNASGFPDTLFLNPLGVYNVVVHTFPPVRKDNIELVVGKHNIIALDIPLGNYITSCNGSSIANNDAQVVIRDTKNAILNVQDLNEKENYISSSYSADVLTTPFYDEHVDVVPNTDNESKIPGFGSVILTGAQNDRLTILYETKNGWHKINELKIGVKSENVKLQPGNYRIVYQPIGSVDSEASKTKFIALEEGKTLTVTLD